jgi:hypothetical protein
VDGRVESVGREWGGWEGGKCREGVGLVLYFLHEADESGLDIVIKYGTA